MKIRDIEFKDNELLFVPLGGASEIGMNMNLYHFDGKWLIVDLGIAFGDDNTPGVDVMVPDPSFIEERRKDLVGIVITHGHEDHIGGIPYLWERFGCPIYATPFTASLIRRKLIEAGLEENAQLVEVPVSNKFEVGPFNLELVTLTHSIPEPNGLILRCGNDVLWHTGDWKLDPEPQIGDKTDIDTLKSISKSGVTAMICDSTNADIPGHTGSEGSLLDSLTSLFSMYSGKIALACFASNVARLRTIALAAKDNERDVALVGRSLWRMYEVAKENGYLLDIPEFVSEKDAGFFPDDKIVLICTGSQGEPRAALSRIADDSHPRVTLKSGDVLIFSSRQIPGNEKAIDRIQNKLMNRGIKIITEEDHHVHVSGHPCHDDMVFMYQTIKPNIAIPVHGEAKHLSANAAIAHKCQIPQVLVPENGCVIRFASGSAEIICNVGSGSLAVDGKRLTRLDSKAMQERHKLLYNGSIFVSIILNEEALCNLTLKITSTGIFTTADEELKAGILSSLCENINNAKLEERLSDDFIKKLSSKIINRFSREKFGKRPLTSIHVVRAL